MTWKASADCPKPTSSAWTGAPRARACSRSSRISAPGALAHHEAVAQGVERPRGLPRGLVELGGQGSHLREGDQRDLDEGRLPRPPGDHGRRLTVPDRLEGQADGVVGGRAGGGGAEVGPAQAELHGDLAGGGVRHQLGHGERRDPVGAFGPHHRVAGQQRADPADAGGEHHPGLVLARSRSISPRGRARPRPGRSASRSSSKRALDDHLVRLHAQLGGPPVRRSRQLPRDCAIVLVLLRAGATMAAQDAAVRLSVN